MTLATDSPRTVAAPLSAGPVWTEERVEKLKELWGKGHSARRCARELGGITRNAVIGKVHRLGLARNEGVTRNASLGGRATARKRYALKGGDRSRGGKNGALVTNLREALERDPVAPARLSRKPGLAPMQFAERKPEAPPLVPFVYEGPGYSIVDLPRGGCKYAVSADDAPSHLFCGEPRQDGSSYCPGHHGIVWTKPKKAPRISDAERQRRRIQGVRNVNARGFK